ncbi:P1 family peptidase [Candidatus Dojkabacteria bacterium]|uniref:P1 family peptidase n=1 Tax=Candidatus Dojkabacteria bacterium TaxID=2099670 RepID=A0A955I7H7_9BACT|nr:P1 family peptidase [Candidatus Saccharibacteria bacterium]MCA9379224.1 P1 family peptidase [Candidatus Dojkabacteria bacterium]
MNNTLTSLNGVRVGHSTHIDKLTGCTVILFDEPYSVAYKAYGGGVGSFNTEGLRSGKTDYKENGIFIAGGSNTGLMSAAEIMDCLRSDRIGSRSGKDNSIYNPSVTGAIVYDQGMQVAPYNPKYGREAYENATAEPVQNGNVGAGTGTSVGKFRWVEGGTKTGAMKAGVGSARIDVGGGITVCALSVVNALGNVVLPDGTILAGNRDEKTDIKPYEDLIDFVTNDRSNTTISVVGINVDLKSKEHYEKLAHLASHGQVRAINPVHTSADGDTVFVFSTAELKSPLNNFAKYFKDTEDDVHFQVDIIGNAAAKAVQESIYDACRQAETIQFEQGYKGVIPASKDLV